MNRNYPYYKVKKQRDLRELLLYCKNKYADQSAFIYNIKKDIITKTYNDVFEDVKGLGNYFISKGYRRKHIAVFAPNSYEWIVSYFAIVNTNNIAVPLDKELLIEDFIDLITHSSTEVLITTKEYADYYKKNKSKLPKIKEVIILDDEKFGNTITKHNKLELYSKVKIDSKSTCSILYTSGTTGKSKGVMLTHSNIANNVTGVAEIFKLGKTNILVLPLHHSFGFNTIVLNCMLQGTEVIINQGLKYILEDFKRFKPTDAVLVPLFVEGFYKKIWKSIEDKNKTKVVKTLIFISNALLKVKIDVRRKLFSEILNVFGGNLKLIISGAAPLSSEYIKGFRSFGIEIRQGYGITECSPVVSACRNNFYNDYSVGQIVPGLKVKINNPDKNGVGEIWVKGHSVMQGYYKNKKETARVLDSKGWFNTEDLGFVDSKKFLFINGRLKNLIILPNGKNVSAEELEQKISKIKDIKEVVVSGKKDNNGVEFYINAEIFIDPDSLSSSNIEIKQNEIKTEIANLNKKLPIFKNINNIEFRECEFPKTTTKKIRR